MKTKNLLLLVLFLALGTLVIFIGVRWTSQTKAQQSPAPEGSIRWAAQQAHAEGVDSILVSTDPNYQQPEDINEAISSQSLFVAQLSATATSWNETTGSITTWNKFNISETLVQRAFTPCANCEVPTVPSELLPISSGQLVVAVPGGSALIDEVLVEEATPLSSVLVQGQRYLLFLNFDPSTNIGELDYGPSGSLLVASDNTFAPIVEDTEGQADVISAGLAAQYGNSLTNLRSALNPVTCNPVQEQNCIDSGGTWNSTNCTCQPAFDPCMKKPWLCP